MKRSSWLYDEDAALKVIPVGLRREILSALRVGPNPKPQTLNLREILSALRVGPNPKPQTLNLREILSALRVGRATAAAVQRSNAAV